MSSVDSTHCNEFPFLTKNRTKHIKGVSSRKGNEIWWLNAPLAHPIYLIWPDCYGFVCTFLASFPDHRRNVSSYSLEIRLVHVWSASRQYFVTNYCTVLQKQTEVRCGCTSNHPCVSFHSMNFHLQWDFGSNKFMHGYGSFSVLDSPKLQCKIQDGKPGYSPTVMSLLLSHTRDGS